MKRKDLKVLYISNFWTGVRPIFLEGTTGLNGMPAFYNTLIRLLDNEDIARVTIYFLGKNIPDKLTVPNKYKSKLTVEGFNNSGKFTFIFSILKALLFSVIACKRQKIDIIYGHGSIGALAGITSLICNVPNLRRIYGTFLFQEIEYSKYKIFFRHPLEYLSFSLPARDIVITNDGTHGDIVFNKIGNKNAKLHFLINGVDKIEEKLPTRIELENTFLNYTNRDYICYVARIDRWKKQDIVIRAMKEVAQLNESIDLLIVGPVCSERYYKELLDYIEKNNLQKRVIFLEGVKQLNARAIIKYSTASLSFYETSNLGNVTLETLILGVPLLTKNINDSLSVIPKELYYESATLEPREISKSILQIYKNPVAARKKAMDAAKFAEAHLRDWDARSLKEIELIKSYSQLME